MEMEMEMEIFLVIVVSIVLSMLVGVYASNKGRSGIGYFIISILLSPLIGLIIAVFTSPNKEIVELDKIKSGRMRKCQYCAELVKTEAVLCKHCGKELPAIEKYSLPESVLNGNLSTAKRLLEAGADIYEVNEDGYTALDLALIRGDKLMIELLRSYYENDKKV